MNNILKQQIDSIIASNSVVLFMKGTKENPQCGFSKRVVEVLRQVVGDFATVDVLSNPEIREGIKVYSSWPTIPQLYVDKEFIGGCDIVLDMYSKNELQKLFSIERADSAPSITVTEKAQAAFSNAATDCHDNEFIRLSISADFDHSLSYDEKLDDDFVVSVGDISLIVDPFSAKKAAGLKVDYVTDNLDSGFAFDNPNEPPLVNELSVEELKALKDEGKEFLLIDVRPDSECELARIDFAKPLSEVDKEFLSSLKKDHPIVFHCHHGGRSKRTAESWRLKGYTKLYNLTGGIDAWSKKIDKAVPVYTK